GWDEDFALLSELRSLRSSAADLNLSPQRKREKLFDVFLRQLEAESRRRPVLMVFEDAHWIDPTSRELLDLTIDRVRRRPVLLTITFRPEFQPPWVGRSHVTSLALNRLDEHDGAALAQELAGNTLGDSRAHRRRAAVRRGADQGSTGKRRARRPGWRSDGHGVASGAVCPGDVTGVVDGPLGSARTGAQGGCSNRRGARPRNWLLTYRARWAARCQPAGSRRWA